MIVAVSLVLVLASLVLVIRERRRAERASEQLDACLRQLERDHRNLP